MTSPSVRSSSVRTALAWTALATLALPGAAQITTRASLTSGGSETSDGVTGKCGLSADGRFVMFESLSPLFVPGDTNARRDVFVRDLVLGTVDRASLTSTGAEPARDCSAIALTPDARFVLLSTSAPGLTPNDTNASTDGFVRDRTLGTLELATVDASGAAVPDGGNVVALSPDARFVLFSSTDATLVPGDTNGVTDAFLRDRQAGTTERVSIDSAGVEGDNASIAYALTPDGRYVVFASAATNLVAADTNGVLDIFVRDRLLATTERISVSSSGAQANSADTDFAGSLSADGRFVVFASNASNLVPGDTNGWADVFLRDRVLGTTTRVSVSSLGAEADHLSRFPTLTPDGRFVLFASLATNLAFGDTNGVEDVFLRDLQFGTLELVSVRTDGGLADGVSQALGTCLSPDAHYVSFVSHATNLDANDTNNKADVFVHNRQASIASFCAGDGSFLDHATACPCGNTGALGHGCGHSFDPAGARLDATGFTTSDDVVLGSHGTPITSFTLFLQHDAAGDTVFHDGVLCASGTLVRLRGRAAVAGAASFPNSAFANDSTITLSQRGGVTLGSGARRYYSAWYRNASSTFCPPATANVTNGLTIDW